VLALVEGVAAGAVEGDAGGDFEGVAIGGAGAHAARVRREHPYDTPEIVGWPIAAGSRRYLDWLEASVQPAGGARANRASTRRLI